MTNHSALQKRVNELLDLADSGRDDLVTHRELLNGTLTVMTQAYGSDSEQVSRGFDFKDIEARYTKNLEHLAKLKNLAMKGALKALKRELELGLTVSVRKRAAGEILSDFIILARQVLEEGAGDPNSKNVAGVLAAAAFEDTVRRMGEEFAGVTTREDLSEILKKLKGTTMQGSQVGIAQSYLNFRNSALHADWAKIDTPEVKSVLAFTEELLLKHFA